MTNQKRKHQRIKRKLMRRRSWLLLMNQIMRMKLTRCLLRLIKKERLANTPLNSWRGTLTTKIVESTNIAVLNSFLKLIKVLPIINNAICCKENWVKIHHVIKGFLKSSKGSSKKIRYGIEWKSQQLQILSEQAWNSKLKTLQLPYSESKSSKK